MKALLFASLLLTMTATHEASLQVCPASQAPADAPRAALPGPGDLVVVASAQPALPGCSATPLGVDASQVDALYPLPLGERPARTILLYGPADQKRFVPGSHDLPQPDPANAAPRRATMPLRANLLPDAKLRPFGIEERVSIERRDGEVRLQCRAGTRPAGVLLDGPWKLALGAFALGADFSGNGNFALQAADAASSARESSYTVGDLAATKTPRSVALPLPAQLDRANWRQFVLLCPSTAATLDLHALRLEPVAPAKPAPRSTWIWDRGEWMDKGDALLAWAKGENIGELFIVVTLDGPRVRDPQQLRAFVRKASAAGIAVTSVEGDPHMALPNHRAATADRARAFAAYNRASAPEERLRAMQFDVEPYLLPDAVLPPNERDQEYLAMARALREAAGDMPLEFVVPFWWWDKSELLEGLANVADGLAVMDYRTAPDEIVRFALPFLDWAAVHHKRVHIALEAGKVGAERQRRYVRADAGEAGELLLAQAGETPVLVLLRQPAKAAAGTLFRFSSERILDGSATSFYGDKDKLRKLLPELERDLGAWAGFAGIALHGWR
ncbi:hypothetical protein [Massilia sp.]|uniref:hypothetical protein n=1 Tax=Massilia sp. TaxID=1882437 RepID=UPI0028AA0C86|nr:hypothetical protein [Massilia sp.]